MAKNNQKQIITALDIGTSKVVALIAAVDANKTLEVIGIGRHPSKGLKRGIVVDIEATVHSIQQAVQAAELLAGCDVRSVYAGISGSHISSLNSYGIVAIKDTEVTQLDIERVLDAAKAVPIPANQKILHFIPQSFVIDNQRCVQEPLGMAGVRLEARVHIVTGAVSAAQNISKCVHRCGLEVNDIILEHLASGYSVLTEDEKDLGICLIDIGGGTTDIAVFYDGAIQHTAVIPVAGDQVTNDLAVGLRMPTKAAELIKIKHGSVAPDMLHAKEMIDIEGVGEKTSRKVASKLLGDIISARYEEIFFLVQQELKQSGYDLRIPAGMVMTGGGSMVKGAVEMAEKCFDMPVRYGYPQKISGLAEVSVDPTLATGVGLLLQGYQQQYEGTYGATSHLGHHAKGIWTRMKEWFNGNF